MFIDLEADEEREFYSWRNIEESEDSTVLEKRGCNSGVDDYETGAYAEIIRYLQRVAPHIRWRYTFDGSDISGLRWRVLCVPSDQISEAQYVFDRFMNGDDLENYSYSDRYPEIYDKQPNKQSKLKDHITKLHGLLIEYEKTISSKKLKLASFIEKLATILPQMYYYARLLPYVSEATDLEYQGNVSINISLSLSPYDEFFCILDPYDKDTETVLLSDLLLSLYEGIEQGLIAFSTNQPELIAAAVNDWRVGFTVEHGWGRDILIALLGIHKAKCKL